MIALGRDFRFGPEVAQYLVGRGGALMILRILLALIGVVAVLTGLAAVGAMFYFLLKRLSRDRAEWRFWTSRYYKAMGLFVLCWGTMAVLFLTAKWLGIQTPIRIRQ